MSEQRLKSQYKSAYFLYAHMFQVLKNILNEKETLAPTVMPL